MPTEEEKKESELNPPVKENANPSSLPPKDDDEDDAELLAVKAEVSEKLNKKSSDEKSYSQKEVNDMFSKFEKRMSQKRDMDEEDFIDLLDPTAVKRIFIRLARLNNKFIIALKNMNTDSYSDEPIYVKNVEHPTRKGEFVPWATFIYDDGTEELYPYLSFMNRGSGIWAEVLEKKETDISEKFGLVDVKTIDDSNEWSQQNTGKKVLAKALKYRTTYVCKDIKAGKVLEVSEDVINKVEAPYADLKKFLDETK